MRLIVVLLLLVAVAASGCDSGGDDPITMFGPSPDIRISTNPDVIGPSETTLVIVQVLNNGNPAVGVDVLLGASGGVFLPAGMIVTDAIEDDTVRATLITNELGVVSIPFFTETSIGPNTTGLAVITATALGASKSEEIRLVITEEVPTGERGEGDEESSGT